jgi:hypothetical protein
VDVYAPDGHRLVRAKPTPASYAQVLESVVGLTDDWDLIDGLFVLRPDSRADPTVFIEALYDPEADREFSLEFEWTRSDLDSLPDDKRDEGYIDFRRTFRIFREHAAHDPMWIEQEIWRDSVFAADPIRIGISGRNLIGHGEVAASIAESRASRRKSWRWAAPRRRG